MRTKNNIHIRRGPRIILLISALALLVAAGVFYCNRSQVREMTGALLNQSKDSSGGDHIGLNYSGNGKMPTIVFGPHWLPQAQFAGYYVAKEKGFYASKGIDVEIRHPLASVNNMDYLIDGTADIISSFLISAMNHRQSGIDLVNIAQISQHSAIMFVSKKGSGIKKLEDLEGKKIGIWLSGFQETPMALIDAHNLNVEWVPILSTVNLFLLDGIDVLTVMWYNEYNQIYLAGIDRDELNHFFMSDYGYNIPEDGLYVLDKTLQERGDDLEKFVAATLQGWDYAANNKEYAVDLVVRLMQEANIPANKTHQRWMLEKILETQCYKNKSLTRTHLDRKDFDQASEIITKHYQTTNGINYDLFFRPVISAQPQSTAP